ncbi:MAG: uroporphyrinogen-III synthase [Pseudomonadota bacterium]
MDVLAALFAKRGADLIRCPLVSIHDTPHIDIIEQWLRDFIDNTPDYFIVLTGEGIRRLTGFAERLAVLEDWIQALSRSNILARGPKPNRALKPLGISAAALAEQPTTDGVIQSLDKMNLSDKRIAVQLYGEDPNEKLQHYLQARKLDYHTVSPYIYASDSETERVVDLVNNLANGRVDIICFTSKAQYQRLERVASTFAIQVELENGLKQTKIAAVGPVVADQLKEAGFSIAVMPEDKFFMKPMVTAIEALVSAGSI